MKNESEWVLRIFCSVDVIGSTAHKSTKPDDIRPLWAQTFQAFYKEFPRLLISCYDDLDDSKFSVPENRLEVWKFLGDEILFNAVLCDYRHTLSHVLALRSAVHKHNRIWKDQKVSLNLKATGWLAGFPVLNTEVSLTVGDGDSQKELVDFIGPAIDSGFRLGKHADENRFVVSVGLASMLLDAMHDTGNHQACKLFFFGREELKGVLQGKPYPIVWIRMGESATLEEQLLGINEKPDHDTLQKFLRNFIVDTAGLHKPFIDNDPSGKYAEVPPEFDAARKGLAESKESADRSNSPDVPDSDGTSATQLDEPRIKPADAGEP